MRKQRLPLTSIIIMALLLVGASTAKARGLNSPGQVISKINTYRAQNGLYAFQSNSVLMQLAQDQSNYMASTGTISHTGPGGTSPKDRAYAVGYGDGQIIFLSEIIYGGRNASIDDAMAFWKASPNHNPWMLSGNYVEIGAGVATNGTSIYYTAVMAYVAGGQAPAPATPGSGDGNNSGNVFVPILIATPNADGSIVHTVQGGQTLLGIATAYGVTVKLLFDLNGLNDFSIIYPDDSITIKAATAQLITSVRTTEPSPNSPTPTSNAELTATSSPPAIPISAAAGVSGEVDSSNNRNDTLGGNTALRWMVLLTAAGIFVMLGSGLLFPKTKEVK